MISWQEIYRDALRTPEELKEFFGVDFPKTNYSIMLPRPLAARIKEQGLNGVLAKQFLPHEEEASMLQQENGLLDPIGDHERHIEGTMIIHRYKNRALLLPTHLCPITCRYCFRKNELSNQDPLFKSTLAKSIEYLKEHPEINEIILSGGDPLVLSDKKLGEIVKSLSEISSVKYLRIHTRTPVIIPERLTDLFFEVLKTAKNNFKMVSFAIHINHQSEISETLSEKLTLLRDLNINLLSQTVLLKGVNDSSEDLINLFSSLIDHGVRPYYLHHPDQVKGAMHFRLPIEKGRTIYQQLRNSLPGWAIPQYILDIPGGMGKVPLFNPENNNFNGQLIGVDGQLHSIQN